MRTWPSVMCGWDEGLHMCIWARGQPQVLFFRNHPPRFFKIGSIPGTRLSLLLQRWLVVNPRELPLSTSPVGVTMLGFCTQILRTGLRSCAYKASTVCTELSAQQPLNAVFSYRRWACLTSLRIQKQWCTVFFFPSLPAPSLSRGLQSLFGNFLRLKFVKTLFFFKKNVL